MTVIPIHVGDLPEGAIPVEMVSVVKFLDEDGSPTLAVRVSDGMSHWEIIGMLTAACDAARTTLTAEMVGDKDSEED